MMLSAHVSKADTGVMRLQTALYALGQKHRDPVLIAVAVDGIVGPQTLAATTRALGKYVVQAPGVIPQSWTNGTSTTIIRKSASEIARFIEQAANSTPPSGIPPQQAAMVPLPGGAQMPYPPQQAYYPPQPGYYPPQPGYYPQPPRGPGGLPTDQASLDIKTFIPAQYDHIRLGPGGALAILAVLGLTFALITQHKKHSKP